MERAEVVEEEEEEGVKMNREGRVEERKKKEAREGERERERERNKKNNGKSRAPIKKERERGDSSVYYRFAEPVIIAGPRNAHRRPLILPLAILFSSLLIRPILGQFSLVLSSLLRAPSCVSPRPILSSIAPTL